MALRGQVSLLRLERDWFGRREEGLARMTMLQIRTVVARREHYPWMVNDRAVEESGRPGMYLSKRAVMSQLWRHSTPKGDLE